MKCVLPVLMATAWLSPVFAQALNPPETTPPKSAFVGYQKFTAKEKLTDWRAANARVQALDGHMGHVRGAPKSKPELKPDAKPSSEPKLEQKK